MLPDYSNLPHQLAALGIAQGSHVGLGVSLRSAGGPNFLLALLDVIGPSGTLLLPAFSPKYPLTTLRLGRVREVFDPKTSPITTGAAARLIHAMPGALRSRHPTNSYVAIGGGAEALLSTHDAREGAYEPYRRLAGMGGVLLSVGLGDVFPAARHLPQIDAGLIDLVPLRYGALFRNADGGVQTFVRQDIGGCTERLPDLVSEARRSGLVRDGEVGPSQAIAAEAAPLLRHMTDALRTQPGAYLCGDTMCLWCRVLERRLASQGRLNGAAMGGAALRVLNWLRLREPLTDSYITPKLTPWLKRTA